MSFCKVMVMKTTLTVTSKGQTTIPVAMRKQLGLDKAGGILFVDINEAKAQATISKPASIEELSARLSQYVKPGLKPVLDVDAYYQKHRKSSD